MVSKSIIEGCKRKERAAFKQCYELCSPYVYTVIKRYISNFEDRKDAMQEAFAHIFYSIDSFDEERGKFKSWLSQITVNQTINFLKRNKKLNFLVPLNSQTDFIEDGSNIGFGEINSTLLQKLVSNMPPGYKTIFLLSYSEGYSHDEIAEILGISNSTSRSQLSRAIKWVRTHYRDQLKSINYG